MARLAVRPQKILPDWAEKTSVLGVASQAVSLYCDGFFIPRVLKNSESSHAI